MNTCTVSSLIAFEAEESPEWRKKTRFPAVNEMVKQIVKYKNEWEKRKDSIDETTVDQVKLYFLKQYVFANLNDGPGSITKEEVKSCLDISITSQRPLSKNEKKIVNLRDAYDLLLDEVKKVEGSDEVKKVKEVKKVEDSVEVKKVEDSEEVKKVEDSDEAKKVRDSDVLKKVEDCDEVNKSTSNDEVKKCYGLLEINLVKSVHKLILKDIGPSANKTKPGEFSKNERLTYFKGEKYVYPTPEDMGKEVQTLLDRYNDLINCVKEEKDSEVLVYKMFKSCSWLLFELLDLHPFSDGNGRLCRLFCSYALSFITPFPTPIYNVWTDSCKEDYKQALVDARKSPNRNPRSLTTMIIECNYSGWIKLFELLDNYNDDLDF